MIFKKCKHYNGGFNNSECKIGISYRKLAGGERFGYLARIPCVQTRLTKEMVSCDKFEEYTEEELKQQKEKSEKAISNIFKAITAIKEQNKKQGIIRCPNCTGRLGFNIASNGHIWAKCDTDGCTNFIQ